MVYCYLLIRKIVFNMWFGRILMSLSSFCWSFISYLPPCIALGSRQELERWAQCNARFEVAQ